MINALARKGAKSDVKRNNRGLTLIELIVVIAIIGVVAGLVGLTVGTAVSAKAQSAAASVNILISKCRTGNLSKTSAIGETFLTLSVEDDKLLARYYENGSLVSTDSFSASGITISYTTKKGVEEPVKKALADGPLTLSFNRSTGGLKPGDDGASCTSILFDAGRVFTIKLVPVTGMHRLV